LYLEKHSLIVTRSLFQIYLLINQALDLLASLLINNIIILRFKKNEFFFNNRNIPNLFFVILIEFKIKINKKTSFYFQVLFFVIIIIEFADIYNNNNRFTNFVG
jgi:hypothetical protein